MKRATAGAILSLVMHSGWSAEACFALHPFWSATGSEVVFYRQCGDARDVVVRDTAAGKDLPITASGDSYLPNWAGNSSRLVFRRRVANTDQLVLLNRDTGREAILLAGLDPQVVGALAFDTENEAVLLVSADRQSQRLVRLNLNGGDTETLVEGLDLLGNVAWSTHGVLFDYRANGRRRIAHWQAGAWRDLFSLEQDAFYPQWNREGTYVAYVRSTHGNADAYQYDLQSGTHCLLRGGHGFDGEATYSPDGQSVMLVSVIDGQPRLVEQAACVNP